MEEESDEACEGGGEGAREREELAALNGVPAPAPALDEKEIQRQKEIQKFMRERIEKLNLNSRK